VKILVQSALITAGVMLVALGAFALSGLKTHALVAAPAAPVHKTLLVDPVCKRTFDPARAAGSCKIDGKTILFDRLECLRKFSANPLKYARVRVHVKLRAEDVMSVSDSSSRPPAEDVVAVSARPSPPPDAMRSGNVSHDPETWKPAAPAAHEDASENPAHESGEDVAIPGVDESTEDPGRPAPGPDSSAGRSAPPAVDESTDRPGPPTRSRQEQPAEPALSDAPSVNEPLPGSFQQPPVRPALVHR
jgi:YHS domain-containing protein